MVGLIKNFSPEIDLQLQSSYLNMGESECERVSERVCVCVNKGVSECVEE